MNQKRKVGEEEHGRDAGRLLDGTSIEHNMEKRGRGGAGQGNAQHTSILTVWGGQNGWRRESDAD